MTPSITIRPLAQADLAEQRDYLENTNPQVAERYLQAVEQTFNQLAQLPGLGAPREYGKPNLSGMRMRPVKGFERYLIFYLPNDNGIDVVRVLHSSRDIARLFALDE